MTQFISHLGTGWGLWAIAFTLFLILAFSISFFNRRMRLRGYSRITLVVAGSILGAIVFAGPTILGVRYYLAAETKKPPEEAGLGLVLTVGLTWASVFTAILIEITKSDPSPPMDQIEPSLIEPSSIDAFKVINNENDLLQLDNRRFLESQFGGLLPGRRRKI